MIVRRVLRQRSSKATSSTLTTDSDLVCNEKLLSKIISKSGSPTFNHSQQKTNCFGTPTCNSHKHYHHNHEYNSPAKKDSAASQNSAPPFISYESASSPATPLKSFSTKIRISVDSAKLSGNNIELSSTASSSQNVVPFFTSSDSNFSTMITSPLATNSASAPSTLDFANMQSKDETLLNFDSGTCSTLMANNKFTCVETDRISNTSSSSSTSSFSSTSSCDGTTSTLTNLNSTTSCNIADCPCQEAATTSTMINFSVNPCLRTKFSKKLNGISKQSKFRKYYF